jgi:hypothetical protein
MSNGMSGRAHSGRIIYTNGIDLKNLSLFVRYFGGKGGQNGKHT